MKTLPTPYKSHKFRKLKMERLEERQMLSVCPAEFNQIRELYPDLNLGEYENYNCIDITDLTGQSLNDAITVAGNTTKDDLIVVRTTKDDNTITLAGSELGITINVSTMGSVTIVSLGEEKLTINADQKSRVFNLGTNTNIALAGLVIPNGKLTMNTSYGGGIYNTGTLTVTDCTISGNANASNRARS